MYLVHSWMSNGVCQYHPKVSVQQLHPSLGLFTHPEAAVLFISHNPIAVRINIIRILLRWRHFLDAQLFLCRRDVEQTCLFPFV
jgi:hypothetical protein